MKTMIGVPLPEALKRRARSAAEAEGITMGAWVRRLIMAALNEKVCISRGKQAVEKS